MKNTRKERQEIGSEPGEDGHMIGRDPREMSADELNQMGHFDEPLSKIIRAKCLDCCCGQITEVRKCTAVDCANWPFRMGKNPFRHREMSEEQKAAVVERFKLAREAKA